MQIESFLKCEKYVFQSSPLPFPIPVPPTYLRHIFGKIIITLLRPNLRILYVLPTPLHIANPPPAICNYRPESVY